MSLFIEGLPLPTTAEEAQIQRAQKERDRRIAEELALSRGGRPEDFEWCDKIGAEIEVLSALESELGGIACASQLTEEAS